MKAISVFDTTISDYNLGNQIIMEAVYKHLKEAFPDDFFFRLPYMEITRHTIKYIRWSDLVFFGGTNSLSSRMERYKQWGVTLLKSLFIKDVILMGLGWWQYQEKESLYTRLLLNRVLSHRHLHSVRDAYTERKLKGIGFENVVNTGCPTLWDLTPAHCAEIPASSASAVVTTLTDYHKDPEYDRRLLELLTRKYRTVSIWIQGVGDRKYLDALGCTGINIIPPFLDSYDAALADPAVEYVGTRLHAGVRALQHKRRTTIIAVDNRAIEMNRDFGIPVIKRDNIDELATRIAGDFPTAIRLPEPEIRRWKGQFAVGSERG